MASLNISLMGCGWLGFPLARALIEKGHRVKGSTTSLGKTSVLEKAGVFPFLADLVLVTQDSRRSAIFVGREGGRVMKEKIREFFDSDILVITLPFRRDFSDPRDYQKQIAAVTDECVKSGRIRFVIFTGATSVYPDRIKSASEEEDFIPDNERARVLREVEKDLLANKNFFACIVRFAGLYGGTRKIGAFLAGKKELSGGNSPVNLIHQDDAVGILKAVIELRDHAGGQIFNACSDGHPTRKELYTAAALRMGLPPPQFVDGDEPATKIVTNEKVKRILNYKFKYPDPLRAPDDAEEKICG